MVGVVIAVVGLAIMIFGRSFPLGRLPGDISYRRGNFSFHFPIVTSIVLSIVLTLVFWLISRFR